MTSEQFLPVDYSQEWLKDGVTLIQFPDEYPWPKEYPPLDREFLSQVGLPQWAAPHMHFDHEDVRPSDASGELLKTIDSRLIMIGSTEENFPICFDPDKPQQLVCIRLEAGSPLQFLNSSVRHLAACLITYRKMVEQAIDFGLKQGYDDAWRQRKYPLEYNQRLQIEIRAIDSCAMSDDAYWTSHFRCLDGTDCLQGDSLDSANNRVNRSGESGGN